YRHQHSERSVARALTAAFDAGRIERDEVVVATKAGYLVPDAVPPALETRDVVGGMHSLATGFLADQLERSRRNLDLATIDVFYLHNPETQLGYITREDFYGRIRAAFAFLESAVEQGAIRYYGAATWEGFRKPHDAQNALSLDRMTELAVGLAGASHHFRFIQLPCNLAMPEAFTLRSGGENVLQAAARLGITVVASASLLQARLSTDLPREIRDQITGASTDAQAAIQFTRSTPGIASALIGMSKPAHVRENLALASVPPLDARSGLFAG